MEGESGKIATRGVDRRIAEFNVVSFAKRRSISIQCFLACADLPRREHRASIHRFDLSAAIGTIELDK